MSTVFYKDARLVSGSVNVTEDGTKESEVNQRLSVEEEEVEADVDFCQRGDVFWSFILTLTAVLTVFIGFTVIHAHTGKEFTVQNIAYTSVSIVSCIVGICVVIICRLTGRKHRRNHKYAVQDKTSTKNNATSRRMIQKTKEKDMFLLRIYKRCFRVFKNVFGNHTRRTIIVEATVYPYHSWKGDKVKPTIIQNGSSERYWSIDAFPPEVHV